MLYGRLRFALIFFFLGLGIILHRQQGWNHAWYLYAAAALLLLTYLLFGNVWSAFNLLKRGRQQEAERLLRQIRFPRLLLRRHRAYYHFAQGMIHLQRQELIPGEKHLLQAEALGLGRPIDRALLQLNLAHIYYLTNAYDQSRRHLDAAWAEPTDDLLIRQNADKLEKALTALQ